MCLTCLTHDINIDAKLASGISIIEHSLVFDSVEGKLFLVDMNKTCPIGDILDLPSPPMAINVEIYPYCYSDNQETIDNKVKQHMT